MPQYPLERDAEEIPDRRRRETHAITDPDELAEVVAYYRRLDEFVFDVETVAPDPYSGLHTPINQVIWIALGAEGRTDVIPVDHPHGNVRLPKRRAPVVNWDHENLTTRGLPRKVTTYRVVDELMWPKRYQLPPGLIWETLHPLFFDQSIRKIGHNVKFDLKTVANPNHFGALPPGPYGDTLILAHILQTSRMFSLDHLVKKVFDHEYQQWGKYIGQAPFADAASYVAQDVRYTWLLWKHLQAGRELFHDLFDIEMQLLEVLCDIERRGVPIDISVLDNIGQTLSVEQAQVREELYRLRGLHEPWNVDSNAEIGRWLFAPKKEGGLGIRPQERFITPHGKNSVSAAALRAYSSRPEVEKLLRHRELTKTRGTYVEGIKGWMVEGMVNPDHKIHGTVTGRLSCASPNLQNIPRVGGDNDDLALAIRSAFLAPDGYQMLVADYDQIELRVAAAWSQDKTMVYGFLEGIDPHRMAAATIFGIDPDEVTKEQRSVGKTFNFALLYGAGYRRIAQTTGMPVEAAKRALEAFWRGYKGFDAWSRSVLRQARRDRAVWTWLGRERALPELLYSDDQVRRRAERQAVNSIIQGTAGEIMKIAMIRLHQRLDPAQARIILTVHDELAVMCVDSLEIVQDTSRAISEAMVGGSLSHFKPYPDEDDDIAIPLTAEVSMGRTWAEAKTG